MTLTRTFGISKRIIKQILKDHRSFAMIFADPEIFYCWPRTWCRFSGGGHIRRDSAGAHARPSGANPEGCEFGYVSNGHDL